MDKLKGHRAAGGKALRLRGHAQGFRGQLARRVPGKADRACRTALVRLQRDGCLSSPSCLRPTRKRRGVIGETRPRRVRPRPENLQRPAPASCSTLQQATAPGDVGRGGVRPSATSADAQQRGHQVRFRLCKREGRARSRNGELITLLDRASAGCAGDVRENSTTRMKASSTRSPRPTGQAFRKSCSSRGRRPRKRAGGSSPTVVLPAAWRYRPTYIVRTFPAMHRHVGTEARAGRAFA